MAPMEATPQRAPATQPRVSGAEKWNSLRAMKMLMVRAMSVQQMPVTKRPMPTSFSACTKVEPDVRPMMAMNMFRPSLSNSQRAEEGMRPKVGCLLRSQPRKSPARSVPPLMLGDRGAPATWRLRDMKLHIKFVGGLFRLPSLTYQFGTPKVKAK